MNTILPIGIGFFIGLMIGIAIGMAINTLMSKHQLSLTLRTFAGFSVLAVWLLFLVASIFNPLIIVPLPLHGVAAGIVSALFGEQYLSSSKTK